jgi:hypothetical protein
MNARPATFRKIIEEKLFFSFALGHSRYSPASKTNKLLDNTMQADQHGLCPVVSGEDDLGVLGRAPCHRFHTKRVNKDTHHHIAASQA